MLVKAPVLSRQGRLEQIVRHLVESDAVIRADTAPADLIAEAVHEHDRIVFGLVEGAAVNDVEGGQGEGGHQYRADGTEAEGVGQNFDEKALYACDVEAGHEVLVARITAAQGLPEFIK